MTCFSGADVLKQLAKMKLQLQSERERVESSLNKEKVIIMVNSVIVKSNE